MWLEKLIEKNIILILNNFWAIVEWMQGGSITVKRWTKCYKVKMQTVWCPDIICFYKKEFIWIEVKKNQEEVDKWIKLRNRYDKWEELPKSYLREKNQIKYMYRILENWWHFILTCSSKEVFNFINNL